MNYFGYRLPRHAILTAAFVREVNKLAASSGSQAQLRARRHGGDVVLVDHVEPAELTQRRRDRNRQRTVRRRLDLEIRTAIRDAGRQRGRLVAQRRDVLVNELPRGCQVRVGPVTSPATRKILLAAYTGVVVRSRGNRVLVHRDAPEQRAPRPKRRRRRDRGLAWVPFGRIAEVLTYPTAYVEDDFWGEVDRAEIASVWVSLHDQPAEAE